MTGIKNPIIPGNKEIAYRDPACIFWDGRYILLMTLSRKKDGFMYNTVAISESCDLKAWSEPRSITEEDCQKNYCSPGSIIKMGDEFLIAVSSYPMPIPYSERGYADNTARLFFIRTKDFKSFSEPQIIMAKGDTPPDMLGRMIDPFVFKDKDKENLYHLFFKQNGVSHSYSHDLIKWTYDGSYDAGENACVIIRGGLYYLIHSPENGIGLKTSEDLKVWCDKGVNTLSQGEWDFAGGRLTAAFAMEAPEDIGYEYIVFFHGSRKGAIPETHGEASIGVAFTNDFSEYFYS